MPESRPSLCCHTPAPLRHCSNETHETCHGRRPPDRNTQEQEHSTLYTLALPPTKHSRTAQPAPFAHAEQCQASPCEFPHGISAASAAALSSLRLNSLAHRPAPPVSAEEALPRVPEARVPGNTRTTRTAPRPERPAAHPSTNKNMSTAPGDPPAPAAAKNRARTLPRPHNARTTRWHSRTRATSPRRALPALGGGPRAAVRELSALPPEQYATAHFAPGLKQVNKRCCGDCAGAPVSRVGAAISRAQRVFWDEVDARCAYNGLPRCLCCPSRLVQCARVVFCLSGPLSWNCWPGYI